MNTINRIVKNMYIRNYNIIDFINITDDKIICIGYKKDNPDIKYIIKIKKSVNVLIEDILLKKISNIYSDYLLKHIEYFKIDNSTDYKCYIFEYIEGITLTEYICKNKTISTINVLNIFCQLLEGISELHKNNIIHCDIKPDNIIIDENNNIKIIDYDLSKNIDKHSDTYMSNNIIGTINYIAPESYDLCIYSVKSDIWNLGMVFYALITRKIPDNKLSSIGSIEKRFNLFKLMDFSEIYTYEKIYNRELCEYIFNMLKFEDYKRPSIQDLLIGIKNVSKKMKNKLNIQRI